MTAYSRVFLIAPPYAVTAYLIVFNHGERYARPRSIVASYLAVLASSAVFELFLGITLFALVANVVLISAFIAFSGYAHPPALALTIFSYLVHDPITFSLTSLVILGVLIGLGAVFERIPRLARILEQGNGGPPSAPV